MNSGRILVTGCAGVVGSRLLGRLEKDGNDVVGFDIAATKREHHGDVREVASLRSALAANVCGVIHLAAVSRVRVAAIDPANAFDVNVRGTANLLRAATELTSRPWVLFVSSKEVYGPQDRFPVPETAPKHPLSWYAKNKLMGEQMVAAAELRSLILRLSSVYGSGSDLPGRVVPSFFRNAIGGSELQVHGAEKTLDFTFIDDVVEGIAAAVQVLRTSKISPPAVQLTSGAETSLGDLARMIVRTCSSNSTVKYVNEDSNFAQRFRGDPSRALSLLGWKAKTSLRDGLEIAYVRTCECIAVHDKPGCGNE